MANQQHPGQQSGDGNRNQPQSAQNNPAKQAPGKETPGKEQGREGDKSTTHGSTSARPENPADLGFDPKPERVEMANAGNKSRNR